MKKALSLLLALVMCLSLCACGGGEEAPTEAETVSNESPAAAITDHPLLPYIYGEWLLTDTEHPEYYLYTTAVINEDGTAIVDGEELVWRIDETYTDDDSLALFFYRGSEKASGVIYDADGWFGPLSADGAMYPSSYAHRATADPEASQAADSYYANVLSLVAGTWMLVDDNEGAPLEITFNEDYTCTVDGTVYPFAIQPYGDAADLYILNNGDFLYETLIDDYSNEYALTLKTDSSWVYYANPAHYDIIEITPENWMDYFQLADPVYYWELDAFEEVQSLRGCSYYLQLKEEYNAKLSTLVTSKNQLTKNAMEIEFSLGYQACDVDISTQTVTPREGATSFDQQITETYKFSISRDLGYSCGLTGGMRYSEDTSYAEIAYPYDMNLLRADCPLYFIKDEYYHTAE